MPKTHYYANKLLNAQWGLGAYTINACYLGVATAAAVPQLDGTGFTEPLAANGYARILMTSTFANLAAAGAIENDKAQITYPEATNQDWGLIRYWGKFDAATGGNLLEFFQLSEDVAIAVGQALQFPIGELDRTEA